ncbi:hypothetical protein TWF103_011394 [Orbilia oligospora]|nr:hypothetical protein TWF103_011394 [Orbilia oligospora]
MRHFYEAYLILHHVLSAAALITLWLHVWQSGSKDGQLYLIVCFSIVGFTFLLQISNFAYRNFSLRKGFNRISVLKQNDILRLRLLVTKPWKFKAGQYIYICVPDASPLACFEFHPFFITWWEETASGEAVAHFLVQPRRGLTRNLLRCQSYEIGDSQPDHTALIEGPYGTYQNLNEYGTIIMLASGIGISAQLPYIQQLVTDHKLCKVKTQKMELHWIIEKEYHRDWVKLWMDKVLDEDTKYVAR